MLIEYLLFYSFALGRKTVFLLLKIPLKTMLFSRQSNLKTLCFNDDF